MILEIRPFGFRTFLNGLGHDIILSLLLVASAVTVVLVMLQRTGLMFPDGAERESSGQATEHCAIKIRVISLFPL
jgi:hypothetical protein